MVKAAFLFSALALPPLISEDVLEPSVQNEVDHALARAPLEAWTEATNGAPDRVASDVFATNGLSATALALKLVSAQGGDGRWFVGTNDCTVAALRVLLSL